jgi:hypothetical protein
MAIEVVELLVEHPLLRLADVLAQCVVGGDGVVEHVPKRKAAVDRAEPHVARLGVAAGDRRSIAWPDELVEPRDRGAAGDGDRVAVS